MMALTRFATLRGDDLLFGNDSCNAQFLGRDGGDTNMSLRSSVGHRSKFLFFNSNCSLQCSVFQFLIVRLPGEAQACTKYAKFSIRHLISADVPTFCKFANPQLVFFAALDFIMQQCRDTVCVFLKAEQKQQASRRSSSRR